MINFKWQNFAISCPTPRFCLSCVLSGNEPGSRTQLPTTLTNKPNTQLKEFYFYMYVKAFRFTGWWSFISKLSKFHSPNKLLRAQCCAQSGPSSRAKWCSVWPKWNNGILSKNAARQCKQNAIIILSDTSHQNMSYHDKYRPTGDIMSVSSKATAAAEWQIKISR